MDLPEPDDRLNSWKEIAAFLGRTVRTVQRWEHDHGLPLRRGGPGRRGAVVASKREIAEWWERRRSLLQDEAVGPAAPGDPRAKPRTLRSRLVWRVAVAGAVLTLSTAFILAFLQRDVRLDPGIYRTGRLLAAATTEGHRPRAIPVGGALAGVTLNAAGTLAYASLYDDSTVAVVDLEGGNVVDRLAVVERPQKVVLTHDGRRLIVAGRGQLGVFDLKRRELHRYQPSKGVIRDLHLSENDRHVWVTLAQDGLQILDLQTGSWATVPTIGCPIYLASAPRSRRLFVSYQCRGPAGRRGRDAVEIIDEVRRTPILSRVGPPLVGNAIAVSPDEEHVWVDTADVCTNPSYDHTGCPPGVGPVLHALSARTLEPLLTLRIPAPKFNSTPIFFPEGNRLVISGHGLRVVDRTLGTVREAVENDARLGAFSADGRRFVTLDGVGNVIVFDLTPAPDTPALREISNHWAGDGSANDVVGGAHAVTAEGTRFAPGRYGQAFAFDHASAGIDFGQQLNADVVTDKTATYAGWVRLRRTGVPMHIASRTGVHGWRWFLTEESRLAFCFSLATPHLSCAEGGVLGPTRLQDGQWTHVALVRREWRIGLFVNGREDVAVTIHPDFKPPYAPWAEAELRLGAGPNGTAPFQGAIDEVLVFGRSLSADDLMHVMRATTLDDLAAREPRQAHQWDPRSRR